VIEPDDAAALMSIPIALRRAAAHVEAETTARPAPGEDAVDGLPVYRSFEHLYAAAFPKVYAFIRSQVSATETAQELVSRIFLKAYRHRDKAPRDAAAMQWVFRVAHTTLIDYWRVEKRRERVSLPLHEIAEIPSGSTSPDAAYERRQQISDLLLIVSDLSHEDQELLALKFAAHRTNREIAAILRLSEGAVSMRVLRALRHLRQRLQRMGWE
jgi:RNA polymerase sigma factor (sigma-70 family)